jgi:MoaA/NifB/PqqE/SkfB family radical SAM enzyme
MNLHDNGQASRQETSRDTSGSHAGELDFLWLEITAQCNLSCVHCYADSGPARALHGRLGLADWLAALGQAADLGCKKVQFIGGEPTLHPDLPTLIESARGLGFSTIEVFTNGTLFTEDLKNSFLRHHIHLAFSVYSAQEDVHEAITREKGSFAKTMASLQWAIGGGLPVRVAVVQMEANAGENIEQTRKMLGEMGVASISSGHLRGIGRGARGKKSEPCFDELCGRCWQQKLCLTANGEIYPCVFARFYPIGNLGQGLGYVLDSPERSAFRTALLAAQSQQRGNAHARSCACEPDFPPVPCDPDLGPVPCDPDLVPVPCDPDLVPVPCDPDLVPVPCDPDLVPVPCDPDLVPVPCDPDLVPVPCEPALGTEPPSRDRLWG